MISTAVTGFQNNNFAEIDNILAGALFTCVLYVALATLVFYHESPCSKAGNVAFLIKSTPVASCAQRDALHVHTPICLSVNQQRAWLHCVFSGQTPNLHSRGLWWCSTLFVMFEVVSSSKNVTRKIFVSTTEGTRVSPVLNVKDLETCWLLLNIQQDYFINFVMSRFSMRAF